MTGTGVDRPSFPTYAELTERDDAPPGSAWGLFGESDECGSINFATPERLVMAARLIRHGMTFNLDYPVDAFSPGLGHRPAPTHKIFSRNEHHRDDYLERLYLQGSSQVDGLRHFRHPQYGFYNGFPDHSITPGSGTIGVNRWADRGIAGRGVLLDLQDLVVDKDGEETAITVNDLKRAARNQEVQILPGTLLLLRTGWARDIRNSIADAEFDPGAPLKSPGLEQSEEMVAWIWDMQLALVAADNLAVERYPPRLDSPFVLPGDDRPEILEVNHAGMMHRVLIPLLGVALGELWNLESLAADCAKDGVWEFFLSVKPLSVVGGVGSPANAMAVK